MTVSLSLTLVFSLLVCSAAARTTTASVTSLTSARLQEVAALSFDEFHQHLREIAVVRVAGTSGATVVRDYLVQQLRGFGKFTVEVDTFSSSTPHGQRSFSNVIATYNPHNRSRIVFAAHYDSKYFADNNFIGATDSAVPCAMLLDMAAMLSSALTPDVPFGVQFIFFDGEEAFVQWTESDSLYGSRHLAEKWSGEPNGANALDKIDLFVLLDLIGAANPTFVDMFRETSTVFQSLSALLRRLKQLQALHNNNISSSFFSTTRGYGGIGDDHVPFQRRGVPILHLISVPFPGVWHTSNDNLAAIDRNTSEDFLVLMRAFAASLLGISKANP